MRLKDQIVAGIACSFVLLCCVAAAGAAEEAAEDDGLVTNAIGMKFKRIPTGSFRMGSETEVDELPRRKVEITTPFYLGVHEVTQGQYEKVTGKKPSRFKSAKRPVENVSWNDAQAFCEKLSKMDKDASYRLPTEAEWEYASRAGTSTIYYWGDEIDERYVWFEDNSEEETGEVGSRRPNAWGLYDMLGNVWEWCQDYYAPSYTGAKQVDPTGPAEGTARVLRGGSWYYGKASCRCANRRKHAPTRVDGDTGFRVVYVPAK